MKKSISLLLLLVVTLLHAQNDFKNAGGTGFVENKGQLCNQHNKPNTNVAFLLNAPGMNIQLRKSGFSYDFYRTEHRKKKIKHHGLLPAQQDTVEYIYTTQLHRVDFDFDGANPFVKIMGQDKLALHTNYYNMPWKSAGIEMVNSYKKVVYQNLYTGIDLLFSIPDDTSKPVEYNFVVHENGNINDIKFRIKGARNRLQDNVIKCSVRFGDFEETIPLSWTESGAGKETLGINYRQLGKNVYGFAANTSLKGKKIIIDPVPVRLWGTYFGGYAAAFPGYITTDALNNVYVSGLTASTQFVATEGTFMSTYTSGSSGAYISKLSSNGSQVWGTYYPVGGKTITVDSDFNVIFCGSTNSSYPNVTSAGAYQASKSSYSDCYIVKLNSSGQRLWGTYYGANGNDNAGAVSITHDSDNNIYLVGETDSTQDMATTGSFQPGLSGGYDGFISKFSPSGSRLWGTYFGGTRPDGLSTVNISDDGYIYVTGTTNSANMTTPGTYKPNWDGTPEIFIGKFDTAGTRLWSTYAGGSGYDYMFRAALRGSKLYLQGRTSSTNNIGTPGSLFPSYVISDNGTDSYFVMCFDTQTQNILYGTYFPSQITGLTVNQNDQALFCGDASSNENIATPDAYMPVKGTYSKSYLVKLGAAGERIWGTYYGGDKAEQNCAVATDTAGDIYMHGITNGSMTGIATPGAHQSSISPANVGATYIVKFRDCNSFSRVSSNSPVCIGQTINLTAQGGANYLWSGPDGFTSIQQNPVIPSATALKAGTYSCAITGTAGCDATQTIEIVVGDTELPVPTVTNLPPLTADCTLSVTQIPTATDRCDGIITATTINPLVYNVPGNYTINWTYTDSSGNVTTQQQQVVVNQPALAVEPNVMLSGCNGTPFNLTQAQALITQIPGATFTYYDDPLNAQQQINAVANPTAYTVTTSSQIFVVVALPGGCNAVSNLLLQSIALPVVPAYTMEKCFGTGQQIFNLADALPSLNPNNEYAVTFYASASDLSNAIPIVNTGSFTTSTPLYSLYVKLVNSAGCIGTGTIELKAGHANNLDLSDYIECEVNGPVLFNLASQQAKIIATLPADNYQFSYYNNYNDAIDGTANNTLNATLSVTAGSTTVYYRVLAPGSCPYIIKQLLIAIPKPDFGLEAVYDICKGEKLNLSLPGGYYRYEWSNGALGQNASFTDAGTYTATITTVVGGVTCQNTQDFTVNVYNSPYVSDIITTDFAGNNNSITVLPFSPDNLYALNGGTYGQDNVFTGLEGGLYTIHVKDKGGCGVTVKTVAVLNYPKFFTPNGDGQSDYWHIKYAATARILVTIFDRYGKLITTVKPNDRGWDGTFNGHPLPATDYWFVIQQQDGIEYRGHFSLIR